MSADKPLPKWKTTASKYIVNDRWLKLRADTCVTPNGATITPWYVLEYPTWINCLAIDKNLDVILLSHFRQGIGDYVTEIIAGVVDADDLSPQAAIERELFEEIGYQGGEIHLTGTSYANPSSHNNRVVSFLAVGGECTGSKLDELGADFTITKLPFKQLIGMLTSPNNPETFQALHLASIFLCFNLIRQPAHSGELARLRQLLG